jgi:hypothetical protein
MPNDGDFYLRAASQRANIIQAETAAAQADLAAHRANGDLESAAEAVQRLANLQAEAANLSTLYSNYRRSTQPPAPAEVSQEERHARPWDRMDYSDTWAISKNSKFGVDEDAFRAGIAEVQRRKARGE